MAETKKTKEALITKFVENVLTADTVINPEKMPTNIRSLALDYFLTLFPTTPVDALCLAIYSKVAQIAAIPRVRLKSNLVKSKDSTVFVNLYGVLFMPSGSGKDRILREINKQFLAPIKDDYAERYEWARQSLISTLKSMALKKFSSSQDQKAYVQRESPREFTWEISSATAEGLSDWLASLHKAAMGGVFWSNSEFEDFILSTRQENADLMSALKDAYDGKAAIKVIKSEKFGSSIGEVPASLLVHTSFSKLVTGTGADKLDHFFTSGFARRSFICFPEDIETDFKEEVTSLEDLYQKEDEDKKELYKKLLRYTGMFKDIYNHTRQAPKKILKFTPEADIKIRAYRDYCEIKHARTKKYENEAILKELLGRSWKTIRLAALIALLEHPKTMTVELEDVDFAIYLAEVWGNQFVNFCQTSNEPAWLSLINFLTRPENINRWIHKTTIIKARLFQAKYSAQWFAENIPLAQEYLTGSNRELQYREVGRVASFRVVEKNILDTNEMQVSTSYDLTSGYKVKKVPFDQLWKVTNSKTNYTATKFKDNYRKNANALGGDTMFILDIDDNWTLEEAKKFINDEGLKALIVTTRHHQIKKDGKEAMDRFRIILPTLTAYQGTDKEYTEIMKNVIKFFKDKADPACTNISRSYYGNPDGQYWYSTGAKVFDWSDFRNLSDLNTMNKRFENAKKSFVVSKDKSKLLKAFETFAGSNLHKGNRDNAMFRLIAWAKDEGLPREQTHALALEMNARAADPLSDFEVSNKITRAYSKK